jgi:DNA-binding transcriptional MerR regulator/methylmalonyl-CoA mutase cobalamin-binding subunit
MKIQQLSQEIGVGIDTLRIWERRYGYPIPGRDGRGHRSYSRNQVEELRVVKKLQDFGQRPGRIFALSSQDRRQLLDRLTSHKPQSNELLQRLIEVMSPQQIAAELAVQRGNLGLSGFIEQYVIPLLQLLDHGWTTGELSIAREHLITAQLENLLKLELDKTATEKRPQILFLTLSGERHKIGLLLSAVIFQQAGLQVVWLRDELPLSEIPLLVTELGVTGVALSFSSHYARRQAKQDLRNLRKHLDPRIKIIAGGHAVQHMSSLPGLLICNDLEQIPQLIRRHFSTPLNKKERQ